MPSKSLAGHEPIRTLLLGSRPQVLWRPLLPSTRRGSEGLERLAVELGVNARPSEPVHLADLRTNGLCHLPRSALLRLSLPARPVFGCARLSAIGRRFGVGRQQKAMADRRQRPVRRRTCGPLQGMPQRLHPRHSPRCRFWRGRIGTGRQRSLHRAPRALLAASIELPPTAVNHPASLAHT